MNPEERDALIARVCAVRLSGGNASGLSAQSVFASASCESHPLDVPQSAVDDAVTIFAAGGCSCHGVSPANETCSGYCDTSSFALAVLASGKVLAVEESSDSSGHG